MSEVKLTNAEFVNAYHTLNQLLSTSDLSTKINWVLGKNLDRLESFYKRYSKCQAEILNKYVLKDEKGQVRLDDNEQPKFAPAMRNEYMTKTNELLECEDSMDFITVKLSDLPDKLGKGIVLKHINFMIEE